MERNDPEYLKMFRWCHDKARYLTVHLGYHSPAMALATYRKNPDAWMLDRLEVDRLEGIDRARASLALPTGPTEIGRICELVKALHAAGHDHAQIMRQTGLTDGSVKRALAMAGVQGAHGRPA